MKTRALLSCAVLAMAFLACPAWAQDFGREPGIERGPSRDSERDASAAPEESRRRGPGPQPSPMFQAVDTNGDGMLSLRELQRAGIQLKKLDTDGDGNVSLEEASPPRGPGRRGPRGPGGLGDLGEPEDTDAMIQRIMQNDKNGDGVLSQDEIPQNLGRVLYEADSNNDQAIDPDELREAIGYMQNRSPNRSGQGGNNRRRGFGGGNPEETARRLMAGDANGDGMLSPDEVPQRMLSRLQGSDLNGDGMLNAEEVRQAVEKMGNRDRDLSRERARGRGIPQERGR